MLFPRIEHCILYNYSRTQLFERIKIKINTLLFIKSRIQLNVFKEFENWIREDLLYTFGHSFSEDEITMLFSDHFWLAVAPLVDFLVDKKSINLSVYEYVNHAFMNASEFYTQDFNNIKKEFDNIELYIEFYMKIVVDVLLGEIEEGR